jgi:hypothetical protein
MTDDITDDDDMTDEQMEQQSIIDSIEWLLPDELRDGFETKPMNRPRAKCAEIVRQGVAYLIGFANELDAPPPAPAPRQFDPYEQKLLDKNGCQETAAARRAQGSSRSGARR